MRRPLLNLLIVFALFLQGVGTAWAATRMAAGEVQMAAHVAELPPCHQEVVKAEIGNTSMNCCGTASCHCAMSCGVLCALSFAASVALFQPQALSLSEPVQIALQRGHYGSALRPPAALQA
ncbi:MAG: CopL family metal-binding regulatory protein [Pseudomonadota bacterium]